MTDQQKEALIAIDKINEELFLKYDKLNQNDPFKDWLSLMPSLTLTMSNNFFMITLSIPSYVGTTILPEIHIYNSENNDRYYYEKSDKYESFYKYIKRKFREVKNELNLIKL